MSGLFGRLNHKRTVGGGQNIKQNIMSITYLLDTYCSASRSIKYGDSKRQRPSSIDKFLWLRFFFRIRDKRVQCFKKLLFYVGLKIPSSDLSDKHDDYCLFL